MQLGGGSRPISPAPARPWGPGVCRRCDCVTAWHSWLWCHGALLLLHPYITHCHNRSRGHLASVQLSNVYMVRLSNDDFYNSTSSFLSLFIPSLPSFQRNHALFHQQEADILQIVRELTVDIKVASGSKRLGVPRWFLLVTPGDLRKRSIIETLCAKWNCYCLLIQML